MGMNTRTDVILWGALGCALVSTAHAEYTLATAAHFNEYVALAVPGALDLYVIRALQQRKDVLAAVLAMVAANVASHLIAGGVLQVGWPVIACVGAVAPLIVWRVYSLKYNASTATGAGSAPVPAAPEADDQQEPDWLGMANQRWAEIKAASQVRAPDHVPASWMETEYPETHPSAPRPCALHEPLMRPLDHECGECGYAWWMHPEVQKRRDTSTPPFLAPVPALVGECDVCELDRSECGHWPRPSAEFHVPGTPMPKHWAPHIAPVPDLPDEYAGSAVHSESPLTATDWDYLPGAQKYVEDTDAPTVRGLKRELRIGQERAERLLTHLGVIL